MRIAYVTETYPPEVNGVALTVERTVRYLREHGHSIDLIRPRQRGEDALDGDGEWRTHGLPIPMYPDLRFGLAFVSTLRRRFERQQPHLVHVATQGPLGRAAVLAATRLGLPVTADFRTNFHWYSHYYRLGWMEPLLRNYLRNFHNRAARTFVPARAMLEQLAADGFERLEVVGRGVDTRLFSPERRSEVLRAGWGATQAGDPVMLYVGRLAPEKNVSLALRAFAAARKLRPRTRMVVVGDGPLRGALQAEYPDALFAGVQRGEALAAHYASADVFLFPSQSETFGNVTLEALASGLAVVAFDAAAAGEYVRHGDNGLLARPGDESAFIHGACSAAAALEPLLGMRLRARETALGAHWDSVLRRFDSRLMQVALQDDGDRARHVVMA